VKASDLRGRTAEVQKATGQLENVGRVRQVRRDIARVLTVLAEQERAKTTTTTAAQAGS
jgi:ribosomal protein L29